MKREELFRLCRDESANPKTWESCGLQTGKLRVCVRRATLILAASCLP